LACLGRLDEARDAYDRATGLSEDDGVRRWLLARKRALTDAARESDGIRDVV
jgi:predicted RNA polymerase sigma factor